jgi:hypothetical protein
MSAFLKTWNANDTQYRSEYDAFFVDAGVAQTLFSTQRTTFGTYEIAVAPEKARNLPERFDLWNPSWKELDIRQIESKQSATIRTKLESPRNSSFGGYGLKRPANQP